MTPEAIADLIRPHVEAAGLEVSKIEVQAYDPELMPGEPTVDVYVAFADGLGPEEIHARMLVASRAMRRDFGSDVRSGYYSRDIGYDDIPAGQAMLEFDCLPFELDVNRAPTPR